MGKILRNTSIFIEKPTRETFRTSRGEAHQPNLLTVEEVGLGRVGNVGNPRNLSQVGFYSFS